MTASENSAAALMAVDWGTTNRRAYLIDCHGIVLETCEDNLGLAAIEAGGFEAAFEALVAPWTEAHGTLPALLSGMVGASTGWREAPYCELPTGLGDLAAKLERVSPDRPIWIVPGVSTHDSTGMPDVIRGEEIQAIAAAGTDNPCLIVLPGTHSKWVRMEAGRIVGFTTYMTGDLHAAILNHTIIGKLVSGSESDNPSAFTEGVAVGHAHHGALTHIIFGARSRVLFGELAPDDIAGYLSGLLIGAEIASALATHETETLPIMLLGSDALCALYSRALEHCDATVHIAAPDLIGKTYRDLALSAGILKDERQ
jgi:2-dehydro-3-deoxygalactonokinase